MIKVPLVLSLLATPAFAADASPSPPTVTLTQAELQTLVQAETSKAVANFAAQQETAKAKSVYDKLQSAFAPKPAQDEPAK